MSELDAFYVHTATVETYEGSGAYGPAYASAITVPCLIERKRRLVRAGDGQQVVSETTVYADTTWAATLAAKSRVTIDGSASTVITASSFTSGPLGLPDHVAAALQ